MKTLPLLPPQTPFESSVQTSLQLLQLPDSGFHRPKTGLVLGQVFFDLTLGKPIWWNGLQWADALGTLV